MKKTTLVSIVMMILLTVSVAAAVSVTYNFYDMHNNQPLNNVDVLGYPCNDAACSSLRLNSPLQGSGNSGTKSTLTLIFPTKLVTPQGYAVYYFRPGYAPQEYRADWWGTLNTHYSIPFNKISECKANIGNVDVQFDNSDSRWELEAHVSSAFTDINSRVNYIPSGFEDYYSSEVFIEVQVYDDEDNFVIGRETTRNILMDNSVSPVFNLGTFDPGNYTAVITTIVIDDQCSSYSDQSKTVHFEVAAQPEDDLEVTLSADPVFGEEPLNVELTCTAANGGSPYTFTFFEDGDEFFSVTLTQPQASITRTFFEGLYNLTCEVQDYHAETAADSVMIIVSESSETPLCSDGIDNDGDGLVDYPADPGCEDADDDNETDPVTLPECSDGLDNDGDGLVDYPADLGCENSGDDDETDSVVIPECDDGLDNDNDGLVDLDDPGCENENDDNETDPAVPPECSDGLDNDGDGLVDLADPGCVNAGDDDETNVICVNHFEISSVRMDGVNVQEGNTYNVPASALSNGYIPFDYYFRNTGIRDIFGRNYTTTMVIGGFIAAQDLSVMPDVNAYSTIIEGQDFDISSALAQGVYNLTVVAYGHDEDACIQADTFQFYARVNTSTPVYACSDSIDNDGDGLVDANDPGCYDSGAYDPFDNNEHDTLPECSDHFDNDDDNHIDLADPGCEDADDDNETDPVTLPECADGLDNDGDGLVDMDDPDCSGSDDDDEGDGTNDAPQVVLLFPEDNSSYQTNQLTFIYGVVDDSSAILECTLYTDITGTFEPYSTQWTPNGYIGFFNYSSIPDGTYIWNVECSDGFSSAFAPWNFTVTVDTSNYIDIPAAVNITATPTSGQEDLGVQFYSSVSGNAPIIYSWNFGDGVSSNSANPFHTYTHDGVFTATLTITDADGDTASDSIIINVTDSGDSDDDEDEEEQDNKVCDLHIGRILMYSDISDVYGDETVEAGGELFVNVYFENIGDFDLDDLSFRALILDLGLSNSVKFDIDKNDDTTRTVMIDIPEDAAPGNYDIQISAHNSCVSRTKYRMFTII